MFPNQTHGAATLWEPGWHASKEQFSYRPTK